MGNEYLDPLKLLEQWNPFQACIWNIDRPVSEEEIRRKILDGDVLPPCRVDNDCSREDHMRRIVWFVLHGWPDAIEVDVGIPAMGTRLAGGSVTGTTGMWHRSCEATGSSWLPVPGR